MTPPAARAPVVSVILPTHNRAARLREALRALTRQTLSPAAYEVVVVDNCSTDATRYVVEEFAGTAAPVRYVFEPRMSYSRATWTGALAAGGPLLAITDDDAVATSAWLAAGIRGFDDARVGMVGSRVLPVYEAEPPPWLTRYKFAYPGDPEPAASFWPHSLADHGPATREVRELTGPGMFLRRAVFLEVGGCPPNAIGTEPEDGSTVQRVYCGGGDWLLSQYVRRAGYRLVYEPEACLFHAVAAYRLTKAWVHRDYAGAGYSDAIEQQHEGPASRAGLMGRLARSLWALAGTAARFGAATILGTGKERYEFDLSYYRARALMELALVRDPGLAGWIWEIAVQGADSDTIHAVAERIPRRLRQLG